ncbi:hypothetical protein RIF29_01999 [Crotalaria pallida]|uniref:Cytochrome P450 n=1 Tax=Crotalaria pallida TaxID=3830 RepID=A0AAN9IZ98_CROPI
MYMVMSLIAPRSATMEFQITAYVFFTFFLFLFALFKVVMKRSKSNKFTTYLPPGPPKFPLIGNLHHFFVRSTPHHTLRNLALKYGPLMLLKLGEISYIIVSSPDVAKEILKTHDSIFSNRPLMVISKLAYNATDIAFSPHGGYWSQLRKICTIELLSAKRVQTFRSIREEEVSKLIETICSSSEGSIVNLSEKIFSVTYGITARAAFGMKSKHQKEFISIVEEAIQIAGGLCIADLYPSIRVLQKFSFMKAKLEKMRRKIDRILANIIDEHRNRKRSHNAASHEDLVDVLLNFQQQKDLEYPLTDDNIKAVILDVFTAGSETSSTVVEWAMSEMVKNPKVMKEAQAEVRRVYNLKGYVDETDIHQLTYLKCVIKETFRLHPPTPLLLPRESKVSCEINGYEIPAKTRVLINAWAIGRDQRNWPEAECFRPERFVHSSIDFKGQDFELIPFGSGRRICPGILFAIADIELPLAQLIYHFDWKLPSSGIKHEEELDMTETYGLTARRGKDLCLIPVTHHHH